MNTDLHNNNIVKLLDLYDYEFPEELIANEPISPRDSAKLLVYHSITDKIEHSTYSELTRFLPKKSVIVFNETKVVPARIEVQKSTGGKARLLYIKHDSNHLYFLSDRHLEIGSTVVLCSNSAVKFTVVAKNESIYTITPNFELSEIFTILQKFGNTPLPPYIKNPSLSGEALHTRYNTVFAKNIGSVAAPTASLHFTNELIQKLTAAGHEICFITLHVNLGTFASLTPKQLEEKKLHSEQYFISENTAQILNQAKAAARPIIAVGTTVVRTLESASNTQAQLEKLSGETSIFITDETPLKFVDHLITNFHVPKSSLMMLVAAFIGREKLLAIYKIAVGLKYRFFSFGDGMIILKN
jgi:S-adenosylmethionine:tRNA ribosyltransferase-isomerase